MASFTIPMNAGALVISLVVGTAVHSNAQNLVPNGSFEQHETCPEFFGYAQYATGWMNLHTNSADYFNNCQDNVVVGVPFNTCGYQEPADGNAYVGLVTTFPGLDWYREIIGIELSESLQPGIPVCLSFKMAVGGFGSWDGNSAMYTSRGVGLRFVNELPTDWPAYLYPNTASLYLDVVPMDSSIWYEVIGEYVPDSNYTYLLVGNFFADSLSSILPIDTSGFGAWGVSYAFIDDVRVSYDLQYCGSSGLQTHEPYRVASAYPIPFMDRFTVNLREPSHDGLNWTLFDARGRQILMGSSATMSKTLTVVTGPLPAGPYILLLNDNDGVYAPLTLVSLSP